MPPILTVPRSFLRIGISILQFLGTLFFVAVVEDPSTISTKRCVEISGCTALRTATVPFLEEFEEDDQNDQTCEQIGPDHGTPLCSGTGVLGKLDVGVAQTLGEHAGNVVQYDDPRLGKLFVKLFQ